MTREQLTLTTLARAGFVDLEHGGRERSTSWPSSRRFRSRQLLPVFARGGRPRRRAGCGAHAAATGARCRLRAVSSSDASRRRSASCGCIGASQGLAEFFLGSPPSWTALAEAGRRAADGRRAARRSARRRSAPSTASPTVVDEEAWTALRIRYRRRLAQIASFDLEQADPVDGLDAVAATPRPTSPRRRSRRRSPSPAA